MSLTACSANSALETQPLSSEAQSRAVRSIVRHPAGSGPIIAKVTNIVPTGSQTVFITGSGFGTEDPYDGDSPYVEVSDVTKNWSAGFSNGWV